MHQFIPFQLVEIETNSYHILISATIGEKPVMLIVDTGASRSVIDKTYDSGVRVDGVEDTIAVGFMSDNVNIEMALLPELRIGNISFENVPAALTDLSALQDLYTKITNLKVAGLLGCDFLVQHIASINFNTKKIFLRTKNK